LIAAFSEKSILKKKSIRPYPPTAAQFEKFRATGQQPTEKKRGGAYTIEDIAAAVVRRWMGRGGGESSGEVFRNSQLLENRLTVRPMEAQC
jgi:hypothetical protein